MSAKAQQKKNGHIDRHEWDASKNNRFKNNETKVETIRQKNLYANVP